MLRLLALAAAAALAACDDLAATADPAREACVRQAGSAGVPTMAFRDVLATKPTPAEFRARFPDITLVMPTDVATRELRLDCSRFFADPDDAGHVVAGRFG